MKISATGKVITLNDTYLLTCSFGSKGEILETDLVLSIFVSLAFGTVTCYYRTLLSVSESFFNHGDQFKFLTIAKDSRLSNFQELS